MNAPSSNTPLRYDHRRLHHKSSRAPGGQYSSGASVEAAQTIGMIITLWPQLEEAMILVMAALLGGGILDAPARQVFRSLNSEQARLKVMRSLLHEARINKHKGAIYDEVIAEFASLNKLRNAYAHSLWYTHESGKMFIAEATSENDMPFLTVKPISPKQIKSTLDRINALTIRIFRDLHLAEIRASLPETPPARRSGGGS